MSRLVFVETSGSGVAALEYARRAGHTVTFLWSPAYDFTSNPARRELARSLAHHVAELPADPGPDDLVRGLKRAGTRPGDVDAVLSTLAFGAPLAARLAERIGARGTPADAVETARDKARCRKRLAAAGLPGVGFAATRTVDDALAAAARFGYPVVCKPALGVGKAVTAVAHGPDDVRRYFDALAAEHRALAPGMAAHLDERVLVEEFADGELFSVEVGADGRSHVPLACAVRKTGADNPVFELGCTVPTGLDAAVERELGEHAADVCRVLGLDLGISHVEVMHTRAGFRLIEANPRLAGGSLPDTITAATGRDPFAVLVDLYDGAALPDRPWESARACSHSLLAAARAGTVPDDLPDDWFGALDAPLHSGWSSARAGGTVVEMRGNFDTFGVVRAVGADVAEAERACAAARDAVERRLGLPLVPEARRAVPS